MGKFLIGQNGKLLLIGGKPLFLSGVSGSTTSIALTPFFLNTSQAADAHFHIQTSAASNDTTGDVPIIFTYVGGAPISVQARVVDTSSTVIVDWTDISGTVSVDGAGNGLGYLNAVPAGINYKRQVRVGTSGTITSADSAAFNIGVMALLWGQSNMRGTLEGNDGSGINNTVPGTAYTERSFFDLGNGAFFGPNSFVGPSNNNAIGSYTTDHMGGLSLLRLTGTTLQNKFGRKIGIAINPWAQNGTALAGFMSTTALTSPMLSNSGTTGGSIGFSSPKNYIVNGDYRIVAWHQGESDSATITRAQRLDDLKQFCHLHINQVAKYSRSPSQLTFLFALMGVANPPQMEVLRAAVLDLVAYAQTVGWDVRVGWNCIDLDPGNASPPDALHFGGLDKTRSVRRLTQSMMHVLDAANVPYGAAGPSIQGTVVPLDSVTSVLTGNATRAGDVVTITVTHEGGTALVAKTPGSTITGWYANTAADFSGTDIALTNVTIVGSNQVQVTATGAPTTFYIKHCGNKFYTANSYHPDVSNLIYDNFVYPTGANAGDQFTGLPLQPTPNAIKVG